LCYISNVVTFPGRFEFFQVCCIFHAQQSRPKAHFSPLPPGDVTKSERLLETATPSAGNPIPCTSFNSVLRNSPFCTIKICPSTCRLLSKQSRNSWQTTLMLIPAATSRALAQGMAAAASGC